MSIGTSSIHYRFATDLDSKRLSFEGIHISINELKRSISELEGISLEYVDLSLKNADTKREYEGACLIPRNSTILVSRVPRATPIKIPKISNNDTSGALPQRNPTTPTVGYINQADFAKMSEEERLKHIRMISTQKYNPINYNRKAFTFQKSTVPADYHCHRCNKLGHHPKQCPLQNIRKATGIPSEELMEASPDDPNALLHPSGKYVIPIMHFKARETRKLVDKALLEREKHLANAKNDTAAAEKETIPSELQCPLCQNLLTEALLAPCCGESFCADCIHDFMLKGSETDEGAQCPTCPTSKPLSAKDLVPNKRIRDAVTRYKALLNTTSNTKSGAIPLAAVPVAAHNVSPLLDDVASKSPIEASRKLYDVSPPPGAIILPTVDLTSMWMAPKAAEQPVAGVSMSPHESVTSPYTSSPKLTSTVTISTVVSPDFNATDSPTVIKSPHISASSSPVITKSPPISATQEKLTLEITPVPPGLNEAPKLPQMKTVCPKIDTKKLEDEDAMIRAWNAIPLDDVSMELFNVQKERMSDVLQTSEKRKRRYSRSPDAVKGKDYYSRSTERYRSRSRDRSYKRSRRDEEKDKNPRDYDVKSKGDKSEEVKEKNHRESSKKDEARDGRSSKNDEEARSRRKEDKKKRKEEKKEKREKERHDDVDKKEKKKKRRSRSYDSR